LNLSVAHRNRRYLHNWDLCILDQNFVDVAKDYCFLKQPPQRMMEYFSGPVL